MIVDKMVPFFVGDPRFSFMLLSILFVSLSFILDQ